MQEFIIYYVGYVTIKVSKYVKIYSVNPLYVIFRNANGYFEIDKNKYFCLIFDKISVWRDEIS